MITLSGNFQVVPKQRARMGRNGFYTPSRTVECEQSIQRVIMSANIEKIAKPLAITVDVTFFIKKKHPRKVPSVRPDLDNLVKTILDASNKLVWDDDSQIVKISAMKTYADFWGWEMTVTSF